MTLLTLPGEPIAQPRHQVANGRAYIPSKHPIHAFKAALRLLARQECRAPLEGPVAVTLHFVFERPKRLSKKIERRIHKSTKPDIDNLEKAVLDALNGIAWADDGQVCSVVKAKYWAAIGEAAGTEIQILELG